MAANLPEGKSMYIWSVPDLYKLTSDKIAGYLTSIGITSALFKTTHGTAAFRPSIPWGENLRPALVDSLHTAGIAVLGWGYVYGTNPAKEAAVAAAQVKKLGLDGYAFDVEEKTFDFTATGPKTVKNLLGAFKDQTPDSPLGFVSYALYRSPSGGTWHNKSTYQTAMGIADFGMPMTYWQSTNPNLSAPADVDRLITRSTAQWQEIAQGKPVIPIGRLYNGDGGSSSPETITRFDALCRELGLIGTSWWALHTLLKGKPAWLNTLKSLAPWPSSKE